MRLPGPASDDERNHIRRDKPGEIELVADAQAGLQERPHRQHMTLDRVPGQSALDGQVVAVIGQQQLDRADRQARRRPRGDAQAAQIPSSDAIAGAVTWLVYLAARRAAKNRSMTSLVNSPAPSPRSAASGSRGPSTAAGRSRACADSHDA